MTQLLDDDEQILV